MRKRETVSVGPVTALSYVLSGAVLILALVIHFWKNIPLPYLFRDPAAITLEGFFLGAVSNYGIVLWAVGLGAGLAGLLAVWKIAPRRTGYFLASGCALTLWLLLDDLYLFHDQMFPGYLGIPEDWVIYAEGLSFLAILIAFRAEIRSVNPTPLVLAMAAFAFSLAVDGIPEHRLGSLHHLLEDGGKLAGITAWMAFWLTTSLILIRRFGGTPDPGPDLTEDPGASRGRPLP